MRCWYVCPKKRIKSGYSFLLNSWGRGRSDYLAVKRPLIVNSLLSLKNPIFILTWAERNSLLSCHLFLEMIIQVYGQIITQCTLFFNLQKRIRDIIWAAIKKKLYDPEKPTKFRNTHMLLSSYLFLLLLLISVYSRMQLLNKY